MTIATSICAVSVLLLMIPQTLNLAKAYSCSSSASSSPSSSVTGSKGSCSTSSSNSRGIGAPNCSAPKCDTNAGNAGNGYFAFSSSGGGSQSSCSTSSGNQHIVASSANSKPGSCP